MSAILQALLTQGGNFGSDIATARQANAQQELEKQKAAIEQIRTGLAIQKLKQDISSYGQPQAMGTVTDPTTKAMSGVTFTPGQGYKTSPLTAGLPTDATPKFKTIQEAALYALQHGDADMLKSIQGLKPPPAPKPTRFESWVDQYRKEHNGKDPSAKEIENFGKQLKESDGAGGANDEIAAYAENVKKGMSISSVPQKLRGKVLEYLKGEGKTVPTKLNQQEQRIFDLTKQIDPKIDQLLKVIDDSGLAGKGGYLDATKSAYEFYGKYKRGVEPDKPYSDIIKAAAALQVMGAAPWMQIGRGKYLYETIQQHLPSPTDSPALLYDKAQFLKGIIDEAKAALPNAEQDAGGGSSAVVSDGGGATGAPPPGSTIVNAEDFIK